MLAKVRIMHGGIWFFVWGCGSVAWVILRLGRSNEFVFLVVVGEG